MVGGGTAYTEGGLATATVLAGPTGVGIDSGGNIFIADRDGNHIYKVTASTQKIATVMGSAGSGFTGETAVDFGGQAASNVVVVSDTQITATAPAGSAGTVHVTVTMWSSSVVRADGKKMFSGRADGEEGPPR